MVPGAAGIAAIYISPRGPAGIVRIGIAGSRLVGLGLGGVRHSALSRVTSACEVIKPGCQDGPLEVRLSRQEHLLPASQKEAGTQGCGNRAAPRRGFPVQEPRRSGQSASPTPVSLPGAWGQYPTRAYFLQLLWGHEETPSRAHDLRSSSAPEGLPWSGPVPAGLVVPCPGGKGSSCLGERAGQVWGGRAGRAGVLGLTSQAAPGPGLADGVFWGWAAWRWAGLWSLGGGAEAFGQGRAWERRGLILRPWSPTVRREVEGKVSGAQGRSNMIQAVFSDGPWHSS